MCSSDLTPPTPVVATRVGGVPDLVEDGVTGYLTDPDDADGLATRIIRVLASPDEARSMGLAGRQRVYPAFTANRLVTDMDALYSRLLAKVRA